MKEIQLTQDKVAIVDDEDYDMLTQYGWYAHRSSGDKRYYAHATINSKTLSMHRFLLGLPPHKPMVDHINNNGLDNRKSNLRTVTARQNAMNVTPRENCASKYKGVSWHKRDKRWEVYISPKVGKRMYVGGSKNEKKAAEIYNNAALDHYGEYAYLNEIE